MSSQQGSAAGDPATEEIEITPEMIRAGVSALCAFDSRFEFEEKCVRDIFEAMMRVRQNR